MNKEISIINPNYDFNINYHYRFHYECTRSDIYIS